MESALQYAAWAIGLTLEILVVQALLGGSYKKYPFIFAYTAVLILTTAVEVVAYNDYFSGVQRLARTRAFYYWVNEGVLDALIFCVVISLIYQATSLLSSRRIVRFSLISGAALFAGISFLIHHNTRAALSEWMTLWSRDLSFSAMVLDLALWAMLVASREKKRRILMLSGALGVQFSGEAIGQSLRSVSRALIWPGNLLILFSDLACLYVWWQTFRARGEGGDDLTRAELVRPSPPASTAPRQN
jgi:hypothetical protein